MIEVYPTILEGFCTVTIDLTGRYTNIYMITYWPVCHETFRPKKLNLNNL